MLTPELIRRTECFGDHRMMTCQEIDRWESARELFAAVREAVERGFRFD